MNAIARTAGELGPGLVKASRPEPIEVACTREASGSWVRTYAWHGRTLQFVRLSCDDDALSWELVTGPPLSLSDEAFLDAFAETVLDHLRDEAFCEP